MEYMPGEGLTPLCTHETSQTPLIACSKISLYREFETAGTSTLNLQESVHQKTTYAFSTASRKGSAQKRSQISS